ncbi:hypothetical protein AF335_08920 [Streptomyces eurocidicus]|uniref:Sporulation protein SsgA n=1 Tax=Streptomyces eurocidicus TaxID=66423 RepID=A0A2N8P0U9_STREU|nr:SsgA family sporulation/cell division regulator [Streptomyces eurocidicus]MBB5121760.1 hypothetical protein [Streptomyces eurocidicus]MBF6055028.1 SsgA family sporulation/cell division regulator [Streptomyces eurocidicus]PNE34645.1 hypothetical protein AF335_08920 [Streptomyces eurocidicus]
MTAIITSNVHMLLESGRHRDPVLTRLEYRSDRPYEVTASFRHAGRAAVSWTFARELLLDGLSAFTGDGDVSVWVLNHDSGHRVYLSLFSRSGLCLLSARAADIAAWCRETTELVPVGSEHEHYDIDAELRAILR